MTRPGITLVLGSFYHQYLRFTIDLSQYHRHRRALQNPAQGLLAGSMLRELRCDSREV